MASKLWVIIGSVLSFLGVALGAFGGHVLKGMLSERSFSIYQIGIQYHLIHSLALLGLGIWSIQNPMVNTQYVGWAFTLGVLAFSGSLYLLAMTEIKAFGMMTPFGGISFLFGWAGFAYMAWKS